MTNPLVAKYTTFNEGKWIKKQWKHANITDLIVFVYGVHTADCKLLEWMFYVVVFARIFFDETKKLLQNERKTESKRKTDSTKWKRTSEHIQMRFMNLFSRISFACHKRQLCAFANIIIVTHSRVIQLNFKCENSFIGKGMKIHWILFQNGTSFMSIFNRFDQNHI